MQMINFIHHQQWQTNENYTIEKIKKRSQLTISTKQILHTVIRRQKLILINYYYYYYYYYYYSLLL